MTSNETTILWCIGTGIVCGFIGFKIGYWMTMGCIDNVVSELYKQLDLDGKPFKTECDGDFKESDDDDFWRS